MKLKNGSMLLAWQESLKGQGPKPESHVQTKVQNSPGRNGMRPPDSVVNASPWWLLPEQETPGAEHEQLSGGLIIVEHGQALTRPKTLSLQNINSMYLSYYCYITLMLLSLSISVVDKEIIYINTQINFFTLVGSVPAIINIAARE